MPEFGAGGTHEAAAIGLMSEMGMAELNHNRNSRRLRQSAGCALRALVIAFACVPLAVAAEFTDVRVGFAGEGRVGVSLPVQATATGLPAGAVVELQVEAVDPAGNLCVQAVDQTATDASGAVDCHGVFRVGRLDGTLRIRLINTADDRVLAERAVRHALLQTNDLTARLNAQEIPDGAPLEPGAPSRLALMKQETFCALVAGDVSGLRELQREVLDRTGSNDDLLLRVLTAESNASLPRQSDAWQSVDAFVLQSDFSMTAAQSAALRAWVLQGGHLILSAGANCPELFESPVSEWIAPEFDLGREPLPVRSLTLAGFQNYVPGARVLSVIGTSFPIARIRSPQVRYELPSIDGPLIARRAIGAGMITFVAVDLTQRPLSNWKSLPGLYETLLANAGMAEDATADRRGGRISSSGVNDLGTQLLWSVDAVPAEERWSSWIVIALMAAWIAVIGPLDYLLVSRIFRRPHLTWVTFPLLVALGCGVIAAARPQPEQPQRLRALNLLDVSESGGQGTARLRSWFSVSAATSRRSSITADPEESAVPGTIDDRASLTWTGRPENVYGGMYRDAGAGLGRLTWRQDATDPRNVRLSEVPLPADGSSAFLADRFRLTEDNTAFRSTLSVAGTGLLSGEFEHSLPTAIQDWIVVHGNRVYRPAPDAGPEVREIAPGTVWTRQSGQVRASDLKSFLKGVRVVRAEGDARRRQRGQTVETPYNPLSTNPVDVLLMTTLYEVAGAQGYVRLQNHQLRHDELSDTIRMNYAVLLGRLDQPLYRIQIDEETVEPDDWVTVVRILLPVELREATAAATPED